MRERESVFSDYCCDLRRKEKEEKSSQKEKVGHSLEIVSKNVNIVLICTILSLDTDGCTKT